MPILKEPATARDIPLLDLVVSLRCILGLPALYPAPAEDVPPPLPADLVVRAVDLRAWIAWAVAGLGLFSGGVPTLGRARAEATRALVGIAMDRNGGNLTQAAKLVETSRRAFRDAMKKAGTYPWVDPLDRTREHIEQGLPVPSDVGVIEDGTAGTVRFAFETLDSGPAYLYRDERVDPLWGGQRVHVQLAYTYAAEHGHVFEAK